MKSRAADHYFSAKFSYLPSEVDARLRPLRAHGHLPGGGPSAPDLTSDQIALMILMMIPRRAVQSFETGVKAAALKLVSPPGFSEPLGWTSPETLTFGGALVLLLERPDVSQWRGLRVEDDGSRAFITVTRDGRPFDLVFVGPDEATEGLEADPDQYERQGSAYMGQAFYMGAGALTQIALTMLHAPPAGWSHDGDQLASRAKAMAAARELDLAGAITNR